MLAFFLGGAVVYETVKPVPRPAAPSTSLRAGYAAAATQAPATAAPELTSDPWQSDELKDFHAVVQWESWVPEKNTKREKSL
jgi:hypothetical protein